MRRGVKTMWYLVRSEWVHPLAEMHQKKTITALQNVTVRYWTENSEKLFWRNASICLHLSIKLSRDIVFLPELINTFRYQQL